jgi:hypothetical protein
MPLRATFLVTGEIQPQSEVVPAQDVTVLFNELSSNCCHPALDFTLPAQRPLRRDKRDEHTA